jgi:hypothetical protein
MGAFEKVEIVAAETIGDLSSKQGSFEKETKTCN